MFYETWLGHQMWESHKRVKAQPILADKLDLWLGMEFIHCQKQQLSTHELGHLFIFFQVFCDFFLINTSFKSSSRASWWLSGKESTCQCRRHGLDPWSRQDSTCRRVTKPVCRNYRACALEPRSHNYWAHMPQLLKPVCPRACALQQEKPHQWEAFTLQLKNSPSLRQLEKSLSSKEDLAQPKINK